MTIKIACNHFNDLPLFMKEMESLSKDELGID